MEADADEPKVGELVGNFRVVERCGHGAYGVGFLCDDLRLKNRRVIAKWGKQATDAVRTKFREQALYEMRIVSEFVRRTHEYDEIGEERRPILVHEFVDGERLDEWIVGKSLGQRLERFSHVVRALLDLARIKFPHGDVHAGNVLVVENRTILFDLDPENFGSTRAGASAGLAAHDGRSLEYLYEDLFSEEERDLLVELGQRVVEGNLDTVLIQALGSRQQEALRPGSSHDDVRDAIVERVIGDVETYERLARLRHAAMQTLIKVFTTALDAVVPAQLRDETRVTPDLAILESQAADAARRRSWHLGGLQVSVGLRNARYAGIDVESSRQGFFPPWPAHLREQSLLACGVTTAGTIFGAGVRNALSAPIPHEGHGPPVWLIKVRSARLAQWRPLDVDRMIDVLKASLLRDDLGEPSRSRRLQVPPREQRVQRAPPKKAKKKSARRGPRK
jgi:hypothetical protein